MSYLPATKLRLIDANASLKKCNHEPTGGEGGVGRFMLPEKAKAVIGKRYLSVQAKLNYLFV